MHLVRYPPNRLVGRSLTWKQLNNLGTKTVKSFEQGCPVMEPGPTSLWMSPSHWCDPDAEKTPPSRCPTSPFPTHTNAPSHPHHTHTPQIHHTHTPQIHHTHTHTQPTNTPHTQTHTRPTTPTHTRTEGERLERIFDLFQENTKHGIVGKASSPRTPRFPVRFAHSTLSRLRALKEH